MDAPGNDVRLAGRAQEKTAERVWVVTREHTALQLDLLATEEPLEIRLRAAGLARRHAALAVLYRRGQEAEQRTVAITMRTPGNDFELAAGFLYGEGVIRSAEDIRQVTHCDDRSLDDARRHNIVNVDLRSGVLPDLYPAQPSGEAARGARDLRRHRRTARGRALRRRREPARRT